MRSALERDVLRRVYDRVAKRYDIQHALATARTDQRGRRMLVAAAVRDGDFVLDAGGGTGSTALLAARAAGPGGKVILADLSAGMLEVARQRVRRAGLAARVVLELGDIARLPFAGAAFDVVLSTYSMCPLGDPADGAIELYRVLRPGGRLGVAHSAEPSRGIIGLLASGIEKIAWRWPMLSLGCRPVSVLPSLLALGAKVVVDRRIGVFWPFRVFVVKKPLTAHGSAV
jgi:ubiquinone/menaquinone biosynthesis C-methylase UbiE